MSDATSAAAPAVEISSQGSGDSDVVMHAEAAPETPAAQAEPQAPPKSLEIAPKTAGDRPAWLPQKFQSPEDLAKAYTELERKQGQPAPAKAEAKAGKGETPAPLNFSQYDAEVQASGALSPESRAAIVATGIPEAIVDAYVEGRQAVSRGVTEAAMGIAGGPEGYAAMSAWAAENQDPATLQQFNRAMASGNKEQVLFAIRGMHAMYRAAGSPAPTDAEPAIRVAGRSPAASGGDVYKSKAEQIADMRDPRYKRDRAFQAQVVEKTRRSNL